MKNIKNIITLVFLSASTLLSAQIVNIPDADFKTALIEATAASITVKDLSGNFFKVDANDDGEIQEAEALQVSYMDVGTLLIFDMTGIEAFVNLIELDMHLLGGLPSVDLSQNINLETLICGSNSEITDLDLSQNINLVHFECEWNGLTSLDLTNNINLEVVIITPLNSGLESLDLTQNTNLITLDCSGHYLLTSLDLSNNVNLQNLDCSFITLTSLDLSQNTNLIDLNCEYTSLTSIDLSANVNLRTFDCNSSYIDVLDFSQNVNIEAINCSHMNLNSIGFSQNVNLITLNCEDNSLASLDVSQCTNLQELYAGVVNVFTSLDLSQNTNLQIFDCDGCGLLEELNLKNGSIESSIALGFSNLSYVCVDDAQVASVLAQVEPGIVVGSYCSFTPGGDYNTITGTNRFDLNANGCDINDIPFPFMRVNIDDGTETGATFTNNAGVYSFYVEAGNFLITPDIENPTFFNVSPIDATINFPDTNNNIATQDFCITANGIHNDVGIVIAPTAPARPGFDAEYVITYKNKGNQTLTGNFSFAYDDTVLDFVSSTETPTTQTTNSITWDYTDLLPFESRSVYVTLNVNGPMETPAINIDDELGFSVIINPITGDALPNDNTFNYKQIVVGSYDPNDITCIEGDIVAPTEIGEYLHYIINFENTGTAFAENIVVKTEIDPTQFDINTLRLLSSSHNADVRVNGNIVEFIFEAIYLDTGGHGNILLKVQSHEDLETEDTVSKNANIYFDYNFPIETNIANTTFQLLNTPEFELDTSIHIYPNPVKDVLNISAKSSIKSVSLYDVQGRLLQTKMNNSNTLTLEIASRASGIYFVKIVSDKGAVVEKIIKQ